MLLKYKNFNQTYILKRKPGFYFYKLFFRYNKNYFTKESL